MVAVVRRPPPQKQAVVARANAAAAATDADLAAAVVLLAREQRLGNLLLRDIALQLRVHGALLGSIEGACSGAWSALRSSLRRRAAREIGADVSDWFAAGRAAAFCSLVVFLALAAQGAGSGGGGGKSSWWDGAPLLSLLPRLPRWAAVQPAAASFWGRLVLLPGKKEQQRQQPGRFFFSFKAARRRTLGPSSLLTSAATRLALWGLGWILLLAWASRAWRLWWRGDNGGGEGVDGDARRRRRRREGRPRNPIARALLWPAARSVAARCGALLSDDVGDALVAALADETASVALDAVVGATSLLFCMGGGNGGGGGRAAAAAAVVWPFLLCSCWFPLSLWCWGKSNSSATGPLAALGLAVAAHVLAPVAVAALAFV
jgi:hypothetical protein